MPERAGEIEPQVVAVEKPEDLNVILGQAHFIKTVEDLHEALAGAVLQLRLGSRSASPQACGSCDGRGTILSWSSSPPATQCDRCRAFVHRVPS